MRELLAKDEKKRFQGQDASISSMRGAAPGDAAWA
jgi:hypothetical protein